MDEPFVIRTYHDPDHGYATLRVFLVETPDGTSLAWAKTSWLLLDLAAGRPVKPASHIEGLKDRSTAEIDPKFRDIPAPAPDASVTRIPWPIRFHDLDANGHVNNAAYFEWIYEATPLDLMEWRVRELSASFRSGVKWGEAVTLEVSECPSETRPEKGLRSFVYRVVSSSRPKDKPMTSFFCTWEFCRS